MSLAPSDFLYSFLLNDRIIFTNSVKIIRSTVIFFALLAAFSISADVVIPMTSKNGIFVIPCKINGTTQEFIFDTGAANVCLSRTLADRMFKNGTLKKSDILV